MASGRVLIVDDDPLVREVLSEMLTAVAGCETVVAEDGLEGLDKVRNGEYDVVFTDLKMPRLGGMDFIKESKLIDPALPIVVITGFATVENAIHAMKEGANDFITKPFRVDSVKFVTDRIISERQLLKEGTGSVNRQGFITRLNGELFKKLREINVMQSIGNELDNVDGNREVYERIIEMASRILMVKEASFGIIENGQLRIVNAVGVPNSQIPLTGSIFEQVVRSRRHCLASFGDINPHTGMPLRNQFLAIPFTVREEVFGILSLSNKDDETTFSDSDVDLALTFAKKAALRIENNALYEVFYANLINTLKSMVIAIESRDSYTLRHSERVTAVALEIAEVMHLRAEDKDAIRFGGYLHDMGKIGVRDAVLLKPDRLTDEEMAEIRLHPVIGDDILKPIRFFPKERELTRHHHERFDGNGYPDGLAGEQIPFNARILSVADSYDAITSHRPYRPARTRRFAIDELKKCAGLQFDPAVVAAFLQTHAAQGGSNGN